MTGYTFPGTAPQDPDLLVTGEEVTTRGLVQSEYPLDSGTIFFTYFTARKTEPITKIRTGVYGTAGATLTRARVGVWSVSAAGLLTPIASSTNDTAMWTGTFQSYAKSLSATWNKTAGTRYAVGLLAVGSTMPVLATHAVKFLDVADGPRVQGELAGQTDFPGGTIADASLANGYRRFQAILLP